MIAKRAKELVIVPTVNQDLMTNVIPVVVMEFATNAVEQGMPRRNWLTLDGLEDMRPKHPDEVNMRKKTTSPITVKIDIELYEKARAISKITGITIRQIIEDGLEYKVTAYLCDRNLNTAVKQMVEFRRSRNE